MLFPRPLALTSRCESGLVMIRIRGLLLPTNSLNSFLDSYPGQGPALMEWIDMSDMASLLAEPYRNTGGIDVEPLPKRHTVL